MTGSAAELEFERLASSYAMGTSKGSPFDDPNMRAVEYWVMTKAMLDAADEDDDEDDDARASALERALPRIQAAWFRAETLVVDADDSELRAHLIENAREHATALGIDPGEAEEALAAISGR